MSDRVRELSESAIAALQRLLREMLDRVPGGERAERELGRTDLRIRLPAPAEHDGAPAAARQLVEDFGRLIDDAMLQAAAFRPGHAYCLRCAESGCEHGSPGSAREVFAGYAPTGLPRWVDFAQFCLDRKIPDLERLFDEPPALLTVSQDGTSLRADLLDVFDEPRHELLGQLTAGFFRFPARDAEGRGIVAVTFQIVGSRPGNGRRRYAMNVIGRTPGGEDLALLWERQRELPWRRAVRWAQSALASLERPAIRRPEERRRIAGILDGVARRVRRASRARARRTRHADDRHESGRRPTRKAVDDTGGATAADVLVDERTGARVVLGDRGRTHFFTVEGKLVSSVRYSRDAIERKRKVGIWRAASAEEIEQLKTRVIG